MERQWAFSSREEPLDPTASYNLSAEKPLGEACAVSNHQYDILFFLNGKTIYN